MAEWEYTKWGMTVEEVLASSSEKLVRTDENFQEQSRSLVSDGRSAAMLAGWNVAAGRKFVALFYFDLATKRLVSVNLNLKEMNKTEDLLRELTEQYGKPDEQTDVTTDFYSVIWKSDGNRVVFLRTPGTAQLNFFAP
jgi:hypothetical protein